MYQGINPDEAIPYVLRKDDPDNPTVWWLRPQTVHKGNRHLAGYNDAYTKKTLDSVAKKTTQEDLAQFLDTVEHIENFIFMGDKIPTAEVLEPELLKKVFYQLDISSYNELMNASRDAFELTDSEKNASGSLSGPASEEKSQTGSVSTVVDAERPTAAPAGPA